MPERRSNFRKNCETTKNHVAHGGLSKAIVLPIHAILLPKDPEYLDQTARDYAQN